MKNTQATLSRKDQDFRTFALTGNMWTVIFHVCFPLMIFQFMNQLFGILDTMMASHISAAAVSAVAYLSQVKNIIGALGSGLAIGSSMKISEAFGAGDYDLVKKRLSTLVAMCFGIGSLVLLLIPFTGTFLRLMGTPEAFIVIGSQYFIISLFGTTIDFFNNVYIAVERSRGNSKRIMRLNTGIILLKLSLTATFVYVLGGDINMIALATVIANITLFGFAVRNLSDTQNVFGFSIKSICFKPHVFIPMLAVAFPVMVEKVAFSAGKTVINAMSKSYGELVVGAMGISDKMMGTVTTLQNGVKDGVAAIISQNLGAGRLDRALDAFKKALIINVILGAVGMTLIFIFIQPITFVFANSAAGLDPVFQDMIIEIFFYAGIGGCIPLGINCAVMALLFGFGYTKLSLIINFSRVFVFRIPVLWALQTFTDLGTKSVGIVMLVSNMGVAILASIIAYFVVRHIKKQAIYSENIATAAASTDLPLD